jgi:hypothetical protein
MARDAFKIVNSDPSSHFILSSVKCRLTLPLHPMTTVTTHFSGGMASCKRSGPGCLVGNPSFHLRISAAQAHTAGHGAIFTDIEESSCECMKNIGSARVRIRVMVF